MLSTYHEFQIFVKRWNEISLSLQDIQQLKTAKGLALQDILSEVHLYVHRSKYEYRSFKYFENGISLMLTFSSTLHLCIAR